MTTQELKDKYTQLYECVATSDEPKYLKTFGRVMTEMFNWFAVNKPDAAEEWLSQLESIKWKNYLTQKEAESIVLSLKPKAPWNYASWEGEMGSMGIVTEECPYYNSYALWVTMNVVYSDSASTIAKIIEVPLPEIPAEMMMKAVHALSIDQLKDADGRFSVRNLSR